MIRFGRPGCGGLLVLALLVAWSSPADSLARSGLRSWGKLKRESPPGTADLIEPIESRIDEVEIQSRRPVLKITERSTHSSFSPCRPPMG
jgi:hypothetical protein